jgi:hypothetical protein
VRSQDEDRWTWLTGILGFDHCSDLGKPSRPLILYHRNWHSSAGCRISGVLEFVVPVDEDDADGLGNERSEDAAPERQRRESQVEQGKDTAQERVCHGGWEQGEGQDFSEIRKAWGELHRSLGQAASVTEGDRSVRYISHVGADRMGMKPSSEPFRAQRPRESCQRVFNF